MFDIPRCSALNGVLPGYKYVPQAQLLEDVLISSLCLCRYAMNDLEINSFYNFPINRHRLFWQRIFDRVCLCSGIANRCIYNDVLIILLQTFNSSIALLLVINSLNTKYLHMYTLSQYF